MTLRRVLSSSALAFALGVPGPVPARAEEAQGAEPATVDLSGRWVFNRDLSDDAREKMREAWEKRGGGRRPMGPGGMGGGMRGPGGGMGGPGGRMGPPPGGTGGDDPRAAMRAIVEPAEALTVTQHGNEIEIDEAQGRVRHLHPDGKKYKADGGASEVKTSWKDGRLLVETKRSRGAEVVETWELVPDGRRIIVNVKTEGGFGPGVEVKRVYDRAHEGDAP